MEIIYVILVIYFLLPILLGYAAGNMNTITGLIKAVKHFINVTGKLILFMFVTLSVVLLWFSAKQEEGYITIILPTLLGLTLNGLVFTIIWEYLRKREQEKEEIKKLETLERLIGNTEFLFQIMSDIDYKKIRTGWDSLYKIELSTIRKIREHYYYCHRIKRNPKDYMQEISVIKDLGISLEKHVPTYRALIPVAYSLDEKCTEIWLEIVAILDRLVINIKTFDYDSINEDSISVVRLFSSQYTQLLDWCIKFHEYKEKRDNLITSNAGVQYNRVQGVRL